jgi:hypothetical protein
MTISRLIVWCGPVRSELDNPLLTIADLILCELKFKIYFLHKVSGGIEMLTAGEGSKFGAASWESVSHIGQ